MAEYKNVHSSTPVKAPKSQLAVEQPVRGGSSLELFNRNPIKKDNPCSKLKKKLQLEGRRGTITIKSNLIPSGWLTHRLENSNNKEILTLL